MVITIGIACFALSLVMFMQFKVVEQTDITSIETMRETELRTELSNWKQKYEEVNKKYEETSKIIEEYKQKKESNNETSTLLQEELNQINMLLGKTNVQGEGITITLIDTNDKKFKADNLIILVNYLKLAGAEAISINEERIINMSDIVDIANSFVKVNGQRMYTPYVIKAIGNQTYLESGLIGNGGYVDDLKKDGYNVEIEKNKKIKINKYNDDINSKYMK